MRTYTLLALVILVVVILLMFSYGEKRRKLANPETILFYHVISISSQRRKIERGMCGEGEQII